MRDRDKAVKELSEAIFQASDEALQRLVEILRAEQQRRKEERQAQ